MRRRMRRVLALLLALPLAAAAVPALATADVPGAGWAAFRLDVPADWSLEVRADIDFQGDFAASGVFVLDDRGRLLSGAWTTLPLDGGLEGRVRSAPLDVAVRHDDPRIDGSYHAGVTLTCMPCRARTLHLVALAGGDVQGAAWEVRGAGATLRAQDADLGAVALRQADLDAAADAGQSVGVARPQAVLLGEARLDVAGTLVGAFVEEDPLPGLLRTRGPHGATWACPCAFPRDAAGAGAYAFDATQADAAGDLLLLAADVRLAPQADGAK